MPLLKAAAIWVILGSSLAAQTEIPEFADVPPRLHGVLTSLRGLSDCFALAPRNSPLRKQGSEEIRKLSRGLLTGWSRNNPASPGTFVNTAPPAAYQDSLTEDLQLCQAAIQTTYSPTALSAVVDDVKIKAQDCLESGMGRLIELEVTTWELDQRASGWLVYYKRRFQGALTSREFQMPNLTNPSTKNPLPPGNYLVRAEKVDNVQTRSIPPVEIQVLGKTRVSADLKAR